MVEECSIGLYADDIMLYASHCDPTQLNKIIEGDLNNITMWIKLNGLKMNVAKMQIMVLNRKNKSNNVEQIQVSIEGTELNKQSSVKYLGVVIDKELTWKAHVNHWRRCCMARMALIRRAGYQLPCQVRKLLFQTFVLPNLDYCFVVWNSCRSVLSNKIERIQNYALRIILQKPPHTSSEELREALGWTMLKTRRHALPGPLVLEERSSELPLTQILHKLYPELFDNQRGQQNPPTRTQYQILPSLQ